MTLLRCQNLTVRLGRKTVIEGFTDDFASGTLTVLSGPNGAGKTTLLRALARVLSPATGFLLLDGLPASEIPRSAWARRHVSMLAWCPLSRTSGTSRPLQTGGRVYCGYSSRPSSKLSFS